MRIGGCKKYYIIHYRAIKLYEGIVFNAPLNYARTLTIIFVGFSYGNAFPILMYALCIYCNWQYWMEKYMILRHYKICNRYGTKMHQITISLLPYCLLIHGMFSWWFYGSPGIMGNCGYDSERSALSWKAIEVRLTSRHSFPFLILTVGLLLFLIIKNTIFRCHQEIKEYLHGEAVEPLGIARNFYNDKDEMEKTGLISYDIKRNPQYSQIISTMEGTQKPDSIKRRSEFKPKVKNPKPKQYKSDQELDEKHNKMVRSDKTQFEKEGLSTTDNKIETRFKKPVNGWMEEESVEENKKINDNNYNSRVKNKLNTNILKESLAEGKHDRDYLSYDSDEDWKNNRVADIEAEALSSRTLERKNSEKENLIGRKLL